MSLRKILSVFLKVCFLHLVSPTPFLDLNTIPKLTNRVWAIIEPHLTHTKLYWNPWIISPSCGESTASCLYLKRKQGGDREVANCCAQLSRVVLDPTGQLGSVWEESFHFWSIKPGIFLAVYFKRKKLKLSILKNVFLGDKYILAQPTSH